jgi:hypothetical protein
MATDFAFLNDNSDATFNKKKGNSVCSVQKAKQSHTIGSLDP